VLYLFLLLKTKKNVRSIPVTFPEDSSAKFNNDKMEQEAPNVEYNSKKKKKVIKANPK